MFALDGAIGLEGHPQRRLARRAEEFMAAHFTEALSVPIIAEATDVSVRQLQDALRGMLEQSPRERLTALRMEQARLHLLTGSGATVIAKVLDCGFSHLGSFAEAYRAAYGEAPSAKLWRAEGGAGAIRKGGPRSG
ncbi:helix-turn-helix domain-containing protein [Salipiger sp.]|uniref:helix-turn-helix domain-containing protein n=1 Tax=Salipiger sp. TaxID=2078585 RepID=UPI003A97B194